MTAATFKTAPLTETPWAELVRLCRQICIDHEREPEKRASSGLLFLRALADVQARFGLTSITEEDLEKIVATEANRVADAAVTAELLLPKIVSALRAMPPTVVAVPSAASAPLSATTNPPVSAASSPGMGTPPPPRKSPRTQPLGVADLIDGMLDQERNETHSR